MRSSIKKIAAIAAISIGLTLLLGIPSTCSATTSSSETAIAFLTDVVKLDLDLYDVELKEIVPGYIGSIVCEEVAYRLDSADSKIEVASKFKDATLVWCKLYNLEGSPIIGGGARSTLNEAKSVIDRYQSFSQESYFQPLTDILNNIDELKSMTTTTGSIKLKITIDENLETIQWMRTVNGVDNPNNRVTLRFRNGTFESFWDSWNLYPTGEFDVEVTRDDAISFAKGVLQSYSYKVGELSVSNFTFIDSPLIAELSMQPRENNTLYPWWDIRLYLDKLYLSMVSGFQVTLWADTGKITHIETISVGGNQIEENSPDPAASPSGPSLIESPSPSPSIPEFLSSIAFPFLLMAAALGAVLFRKRVRSTLS
jgi:hypothetical protein